MISMFDLYDLSAVFQGIRYNITYNNNINILKAIIELLCNYNKSSIYFSNQIRNSLSSIANLDENWSIK